MKILNGLFCFFVLGLAISAQTKVVPIVEMKVGGLLGGVENGKYLDAKTTIARLAAEQNYTLFLLGGATGETMQIKKPTASMDVCDDFYSLEYGENEDNEKRRSKGGVALGEGFKWNPILRVPQPINLNDAAYKKIVADVLRSKGIAKTTLKLTQAVRVDLEGDGQEEVLISATYYSGDIASTAKKGNYSFVMLRKIVGGKVQNTVIDGDFITKNIDFGAPSAYEISAIADLNGDGKMEIVIYSAYYEGSSSGVYEMKGNKPVEVKALSVGCGV